MCGGGEQKDGYHCACPWHPIPKLVAMIQDKFSTSGSSTKYCRGKISQHLLGGSVMSAIPTANCLAILYISLCFYQSGHLFPKLLRSPNVTHYTICTIKVIFFWKNLLQAQKHHHRISHHRSVPAKMQVSWLGIA